MAIFHNRYGSKKDYPAIDLTGANDRDYVTSDAEYRTALRKKLIEEV